MYLEEFKNKVNVLSEINNICFNDEQVEKLYKYMNLLLEWNEKMNLTAITDENEVILKHFIDSAIVNNYINKGKSVIDVGTGAGFPGLVLKIVNKELDITLLDALNKRIIFLDEVIKECELEDINAIHGRAEDYGKDEKFRETFDVVTSRAVANMNVLLEYMMPLVKVGGVCICMKSVSADEEVENAKNVIELLGGELKKIEKVHLKNENNEILERSFVVIRKKCSTEKMYPRTSNKIGKKPLV